MKLVVKVSLAILSLGFLLYLLWPFEPQSIEQFSDLPGSARSKLSGDTVEVPNLKAYFSNSYRHIVTDTYRNEYQLLHQFPFPPLRVNHPPEEAFFFIKDQTQSTYLEEYTYFLRGSLFINGLEPFEEVVKKPRYDGATPFVQDGVEYETKTVIRLYQTAIWARLLVWFGVCLSMVLLWKAGKIVNS